MDRIVLCGFFHRRNINERKLEAELPMRSEDSPRLMTLGSEAMMRLCEEAGEADRLCREVRVLTGGSRPPLDAWNQETSWS